MEPRGRPCRGSVCIEKGLRYRVLTQETWMEFDVFSLFRFEKCGGISYKLDYFVSFGTFLLRDWLEHANKCGGITLRVCVLLN